MQTVLGAGGPIADELIRALGRDHTDAIRVVSRQPRRLHDTDELIAADLTDAEATDRAVAGSDIAYLTVGLPPDSALWERQFPVIMRNVIEACARHGARLVFFDNTYMYPGTSTPQTESTPFAPHGRKGRVRAHLATMLLEAMAVGLPVIVSRVSGAAEAVLDGETGFVVPIGDSRALAAAMQRMIADPQIAKAFGRSGRQRLEQKFTMENMIRNIERLYEKVVPDGLAA